MIRAVAKILVEKLRLFDGFPSFSLLVFLLLPSLCLLGCGGSVKLTNASTAADGGTPIVCTTGTDNDGDGYGLGCEAGDDCNDEDRNIFPGAEERCDGVDNNCNKETDEDVLNECGTCSIECSRFGDEPFSQDDIDPAKNPAIKESTHISIDEDGNLTIEPNRAEKQYMWIANSYDWRVGTVSKIDTREMREVARYFTTTCDAKHSDASDPIDGCRDRHGRPIVRWGHSTQTDYSHLPSRTAVDHNFDVWVANRAFWGSRDARKYGQPSATKIINDSTQCIDKEANDPNSPYHGVQTSRDLNGNKRIEVDCDEDGKPDSRETRCPAENCDAALRGTDGKCPPEFYGYDDECVAFTVNFGDVGEIGRSICLDGTIDTGPGTAWVGTNHDPAQRGYRRFFRIDGRTGELSPPDGYPFVAGHGPYGCVIDAQHVLWSVSGSSLAYLDTRDPTRKGIVPRAPSSWGTQRFYGITIDDENAIWLGGNTSNAIYRYRPDRRSRDKLGEGTWTAAVYPKILHDVSSTDAFWNASRGIAADRKGYIWTALNQGYVWRVTRNLADGIRHDFSGDATNYAQYWRVGYASQNAPRSGLSGVGVDFQGNVWGIQSGNPASVASRLPIGGDGTPVPGELMTSDSNKVLVGRSTYTYSDFTGLGRNLVFAKGTLIVQLECEDNIEGTWGQVNWQARTPGNSSIKVRIRSGNTESFMGFWTDDAFDTPPVNLGSEVTIAPDPSRLLQIEFTFEADDQQQESPVLEGFQVSSSCRYKIR